jgi:hypothetical protein
MQPGGGYEDALTLLAVAAVLVAPNLSAMQSVAEPETLAIRAGIPESDSELTPDVMRHVGQAICCAANYASPTRQRSMCEQQTARREGTCRAEQRGCSPMPTSTPAT